MWRKGNPLILLLECKLVQYSHYGEQCGESLKNEIELPYDCTVGHMIVLLGIQLLGLYAQQSHC